MNGSLLKGISSFVKYISLDAQRSRFLLLDRHRQAKHYLEQLQMKTLTIFICLDLGY